MSFGKIMKTIPSSLVGLCDVYVEVERRDFRILQLTDMQIIDAAQRRTPDRISEEKIAYWATDRAEENCYSHIRDLVAQSSPCQGLASGGAFDRPTWRSIVYFLNGEDDLPAQSHPLLYKILDNLLHLW